MGRDGVTEKAKGHWGTVGRGEGGRVDNGPILGGYL